MPCWPIGQCWGCAAAFPSVPMLSCANNSFPWSLHSYLESITGLGTCRSPAAKSYRKRWVCHIFLEIKFGILRQQETKPMVPTLEAPQWEKCSLNSRERETFWLLPLSTSSSKNRKCQLFYYCVTKVSVWIFSPTKDWLVILYTRLRYLTNPTVLNLLN